VHVIRGEVLVNGEPLSAGDALKVWGVKELRLDHARDAEVLLFDLS